MFQVFSFEVWLLIFLSSFVVALAIKLNSKKSFKTLFFTLLLYLLGIPLPMKKKYTMLLAFWIWFCITINTIYQSGYQSAMMMPNIPIQINTWEEVLTSDLNIIGRPEIVKDLLPHLVNSYNISENRLKLINKRIKFEGWVDRLVVHKDSAFLGFKEIIKYHLSRVRLDSRMYTQPSCVIKHWLAFVLKKNSFLTKKVSKYSKLLNSNGYTNYLLKKHLLNEIKPKMPKNVIEFLNYIASKTASKTHISATMDKMIVVFWGYLVGISAAFTVFLVEVLSKRNENKMKQCFMIRKYRLQKHKRLLENTSQKKSRKTRK